MIRSFLLQTSRSLGWTVTLCAALCAALCIASASDTGSTDTESCSFKIRLFRLELADTHFTEPIIVNTADNGSTSRDHVDIRVNGIVVLDNIEFPSIPGGTHSESFPVETGDLITVDTYASQYWDIGYEILDDTLECAYRDIAMDGVLGVTDLPAICSAYTPPTPGFDCCDHTVELETDHSYHGWGGAALLVTVNGNYVLWYETCPPDISHVEVHFPARNGDTIETIYVNSDRGEWNSYRIYNGWGFMLCEEGGDGQVPGDCTVTGSCPECLNTGDVTLDGALTSEDAQAAFMIALRIITPTYDEACAADCNDDDNVTAGDAQQIFMAVLGMGNCADPLVSVTF